MQKIIEASNFIQKQLQDFAPETGIILGTGLGSLVQDIRIIHQIEYSTIPHFPVSTVESHQGRLIFGYIGTHKVVVMQGRFHYYEGYSMQQVVFPVRVLRMLGIKRLFVSNAAGGLNPTFEIGDLMLIHDHINLLPENPLVGKNKDELGIRFPDMSEPYSLAFLQKAKEISSSLGIKVQEGVYVSVSGPNLETRAEYKYLRIIGADAVGMSTVPEVIAARHMDIPVFAVSAITDLCYGDKIKKVSLDEIIAAAQIAEPKLSSLFKEMIMCL